MMYNFADGGDSDEGTVLGISHMPYTIVGSTALEGLETTKAKNIQKRQLKYPHCVSINSLYANKNGNGGYYESDRYANSNHEATYISPFDVVVTLSHELGHYLGLFHAFSEHKVENADGTTTTDTSEGCYDTDYCEDTPSYNRTEYMEYIEYYMKSHSTPRLQNVLLSTPCEGDNYLSANIMDYSYTLGYKISAQHKEYQQQGFGDKCVGRWQQAATKPLRLRRHTRDNTCVCQQSVRNRYYGCRHSHEIYDRIFMHSRGRTCDNRHRAYAPSSYRNIGRRLALSWCRHRICGRRGLSALEDKRQNPRGR